MACSLAVAPRNPKPVASRSLAELQAALPPVPPPGRTFMRLCDELSAAAQAVIAGGDWRTLLDLRAWAWQHPLFMTPKARLRGHLRTWEEALISWAPLAEAAALVRDDVATATRAPWERLAARGTWDELRPLLRDDASAWSVAEARVLRGEALAGRGPFSGMPLRRFRWEPWPDAPVHSPGGLSWSGHEFAGELTPTTLPPATEELACERAWGPVLSVFGDVEKRVVKVAGSGPQALAGLLGPREVLAGPCTWKEALWCLLRAHGDSGPWTEGHGMVAARRAVWRLLAALAGTRWPVSGSALQAAMKGWQWSRYDPQEPYAEANSWSVFLVLEDRRRGLAWAAYTWVTD